MKHAGNTTLDTLEPLLSQLRSLPLLRERKRGIFYLKSRSFLHFHEDPNGIFADLRVKEDFVRFDVTTPDAQGKLIIATLESLRNA